MKELLKTIREAFEASSWKRGYHQSNVFKVFENEFGGINIDTCMTVMVGDSFIMLTSSSMLVNMVGYGNTFKLHII